MANIYESRISTNTRNLLAFTSSDKTVSNLVSASVSVPTATTTITGNVRFAVAGTFSSATVTLEVRDPNGVYAVVSGSSITAAATTLFSFPPKAKNIFRAGITGSAADVLLSLWLQGGSS